MIKSILDAYNRRPPSFLLVPSALQRQSKTLLAPRSLSSKEARKAQDGWRRGAQRTSRWHISAGTVGMEGEWVQEESLLRKMRGEGIERKNCKPWVRGINRVIYQLIPGHRVEFSLPILPPQSLLCTPQSPLCVYIHAVRPSGLTGFEA